MNAIQKFLGLIKNALTTPLFPSDTIHITIGTILLIITALIFINISPLHEEKYGVFLYYFGKN